MGKIRYFVKDENDDYNMRAERTFLALDESKISQMVHMQGIVYTNNINSIDTYKYEGFDSDIHLEISEISDCYYVSEENFTTDQLDYISSQDFDDDNINKEIIKVFNEKSSKCDDLQSYEAYHYFDGSNQKQIDLTFYGHETYWIDYTDELEGMKEIDIERGNTFIDRLYLLKDGSKAIVTESFYQGELNRILFLTMNTDIETIKEYREKEKTDIFDNLF